MKRRTPRKPRRKVTLPPGQSPAQLPGSVGEWKLQRLQVRRKGYANVWKKVR